MSCESFDTPVTRDSIVVKWSIMTTMLAEGPHVKLMQAVFAVALLKLNAFGYSREHHATLTNAEKCLQVIQ